MPCSLRGSAAPGPGRIRDFCHGLLWLQDGRWMLAEDPGALPCRPLQGKRNFGSGAGPCERGVDGLAGEAWPRGRRDRLARNRERVGRTVETCARQEDLDCLRFGTDWAYAVGKLRTREPAYGFAEERSMWNPALPVPEEVRGAMTVYLSSVGCARVGRRRAWRSRWGNAGAERRHHLERGEDLASNAVRRSIECAVKARTSRIRPATAAGR